MLEKLLICRMRYYMNLYDLINMYQITRNDYYFNSILDIFKPYISKLSKQTRYTYCSEDLTILLFEIIINIDINRFDTECLRRYIYKSLKNHYIFLNKKHKQIIDNELVMLENDCIIKDNYEFMFDDLLIKLTDKEKYIIKLIFYYGYSGEEISRFLNVSRQRISNIKRSALIKLKKNA